MKRSPLKRKTPLKARTPVKRAKLPRKAANPPKTRTTTTAKLKKELDRVFSLYIRAKYPKYCYTCGKKNIELQCGHFISRQYLATRWSEMNARPQCVGCNVFGNGKPLDFEERLKKEFGADAIERLKASRHNVLKLDRAWYEAMIVLYKDLLKTYIAEK